MKYENRLFVLRGRRSQAEFAKMLGLSQQNYGNYENGKQGLKSDMIVKICKMFNCSAEWLLCLDSGERDDDFSEIATIYYSLSPEGRKAMLASARGMRFSYHSDESRDMP